MIRFIFRQIDEIRHGGITTFLKKINNLYKALLKAPFVLAALPVIVIIRFLRPFVLIRFGAFSNLRIGELGSQPELYLCERDIGMHGKRTYDIFYILLPVCNEQLRKMWKRVLNIFPGAYYLSLANQCLPGAIKHIAKTPTYYSNLGELLEQPTHVSFIFEEECLGDQGLREMGLPENTPFVSFIGRDSAYLDCLYPHTDRDHWKYHDHRDMNIQKFIPMAEELVQRGLPAIRMGSVVQDLLVSDNPGIIDYASNFRTDFLDIYLCAKCYFFVNGMAGLDAIPWFIFRRPIVKINFIPLGYILPGYNETIHIPKKLWLKAERRFMSFREIFESEVRSFALSNQYKKAGIEPIENTPDEITAVVMEMEERLKGEWQTSEEEEELQQRFWGLFKSSNPITIHTRKDSWSQARIGTEFLRQNQGLLE